MSTTPKEKPFKPRHLPIWADEPITFSIDPDETLKHGAFANVPKVKSLKKSVRAVSKSSR
jgi:hypothetical protein